MDSYINQVKVQVESSVKRLDRELSDNNPFANGLAFLERKTKVDRKYLLSLFIALIVAYLIFGHAKDLLVTIWGFGYPAYQSFKAIESSSKQDDTQWLIYWVVFSSFRIAEFFGDALFHWVPAYFLLKFMVLTYLHYFYGASTIYENVLKPFLLKHEGKVDKAIDKAKGLKNFVENEAAHVASKVTIKKDE